MESKFKEHVVVWDLSRFMYNQFKESLTHVPKLERKLSKAECNLAATITEVEGSKAKVIVEMEKMPSGTSFSRKRHT